ncbi:MAG: hypothetical protein ACFFAO_12485 [Candidatus Hermodarchaeota archaeon]
MRIIGVINQIKQKTNKSCRECWSENNYKEPKETQILLLKYLYFDIARYLCPKHGIKAIRPEIKKRKIEIMKLLSEIKKLEEMKSRLKRAKEFE